MKMKVNMLLLALVTLLLSGCTSAFYASSGANDDLYAIHNRTEIARRQQAEAEAKAFIDSLIDYARYSGISVTNLQKQETGIFVLTVDRVDLTLYQASVAGTGITLESGSQIIKVFFTDRKLTGIDSETVLDAKYNNQAMQMTITSSVQFVTAE